MKNEPDTEPAFAPGDLVVDAADDESGDDYAVVLSYRRTDDGGLVPAWAAPIRALDGTTVAEVNSDYPEDDAVVTVAFANHLDTHVGRRWRAWAAEADDDANYEFHGRISDYAADWAVNLQTYDYPESRLEPADASIEAIDDE